MDIIFFVYGLAFILLGVVIFVLPKRHSEYQLAGFIGFLAAFGFVHGFLEWADLWKILKGGSPFLSGLRIALLIASFLLLFEFSRRLLRASLPGGHSVARLLGPAVYAVVLPLLGMGVMSARDPMLGADIWTRYLLGFTGATGAGIGLHLYFRERVAAVLAPGERAATRRYFLLGSAAFVGYGVFTGLVVPTGDFFPANTFNYPAFQAATGAPVQAFRALCAVLAALAVSNILCIFHFEGRDKLVAALDKSQSLLQELQQLNQELEGRVAEEVEKNREKEHLLFQQSRLASMGEMFGYIAHQWRQPLNTIGLVLSNIKDAFQFGDLNEAYLGEQVSIGNRLVQQMSVTIDEFRRFFRPSTAQEHFAVGRVVRKSLDLVEASFRNHGHAIGLNIVSDGEILGYASEFQEVLVNLLNNAQDIFLERKIAAGKVDVEIVHDDAVLRVIVRDNGGGIPEAVLPKIFDPYFTTRASGTGIGLYMAKIIVEKHMGGRIAGRNHGDGAEFTVTLPATPAASSTQ